MAKTSTNYSLHEIVHFYFQQFISRAYTIDLTVIVLFDESMLLIVMQMYFVSHYNSHWSSNEKSL